MINTMRMLGLVLLTLVVGCGSRYDCDCAEALAGAPEWMGNLSWKPCLNKSDQQYYMLLVNTHGDRLLSWAADIEKGDAQPSWGDAWAGYSMTDTAWSKRKAALLHARCKLTYSWGTWMEFDGVSSIIYNVAYIFSAPCKILKTLRCSDGVWGWIKDVISILISVAFALIGFCIESILGLVVHPVETLANVCGIMNFGEGWFNYFVHTNLIASLWDLVWGGIIYPLWQMLIFWL